MAIRAKPLFFQGRSWRFRLLMEEMKAAYITRTGGPEVILYDAFPRPAPRPTPCLLSVTAVAVHWFAVSVGSGLVPARLPFPPILGRDLAGTIVRTGAAVKQFKVGDKVWSSNQGSEGRPGTFAELAAVDERWLYPIPAATTAEETVALSLVGITAHLGLVKHAQLQADEVLFVNGGTGGVGSSVVQMAKALGARVIATAGTDEKVQICRKLGATLALNYKTQNVDEEVRKFAPQGVNVWWETVREPNFHRIISLLALRGRMIVMAGRDAKPEFPVGPFYTKDCSLHGFAIFNSSAAEQRTAANDMNRWMQEGKLQSFVKN